MAGRRERLCDGAVRRAGFLTRLLGFLFKLLPKVGPLRPLAFEAPTPEAERLFANSLIATRERYHTALKAVAGRRLNLVNTDFDIGKPARHGENELADETYAELLDKLASRNYARTPRALRHAIRSFYADLDPDRAQSEKERKRARKLKQELARLGE
jgi:hypothetical protein